MECRCIAACAEMTSGVEMMQLRFSFRHIPCSGSGLGGLLCIGGMAVPSLTTAQSDEQQETYRQLGLFGDVFQRIRDLMSMRLRTRN